jgi:hypothetical protein
MDLEPLQTVESSSVFWGAGYMICTHTLVRTIQFPTPARSPAPSNPRSATTDPNTIEMTDARFRKAFSRLYSSLLRLTPAYLGCSRLE